MASEIQIGQLFNYHPRKSRSQAVCFVSPAKEDRLKQARLFVLGQIPLLPGINEEEILNSIKENLVSFYYSPDPLNGQGQDIESRFERALESTNMKLQNTISDNDQKLLKKMDLIAGIAYGQQVCFAQRRQTKAYLVQANRILSILESPSPPSAGSGQGSKIFSHIISGSLETNTSLIFCTANFLDYFSEEKVIKVVNSFSPLRACEYLAGLLAEENNTTLGAIIISALSPREDLTEAARPAEEKVGPSHKVKIEMPAEGPAKKLPVHRPGQMKKIVRPFLPVSKQIISCTRKILGGRKEIVKNLLNLKNLTHPSKILLIIILVLAVIFIQSIILLVRKEIKERRARAYTSLIEEIQEKTNTISATLIYQDDQKAKKLLQELEKLLDSLPKDSPERKSTFETLFQEYQKYINKLYNITTLESPRILADFSILGQNIKVAGIELLDNIVYGWNPVNNSIYSLNPEDGEIQTLSQSSKNIGHLKYAASEGERLIFFHDGGSLAQYLPAKKTLTSLNLASELQPNPTAIFAYGGNLYLLWPEKNQIYKYLPTIEGFGKEEAWVKEKGLNLYDSVSLAIDAAIYILKKNGQVLKLYKGERVGFNLETLEPNLKELPPHLRTSGGQAKIYTNKDLNFLYILDPSTKRLVIFDKNGQLRKQYTSPDFDSLKDFLVDKSKNKIYLLNNTKVFEIDLTSE